MFSLVQENTGCQELPPEANRCPESEKSILSSIIEGIN